MIDVLRPKIEAQFKSWGSCIPDGGNAVPGERLSEVTVMLRAKFRNYIQAVVEKLAENVSVIPKNDTCSFYLFIANSHFCFLNNFLFMSLVEVTKRDKAEKGTPRFKGNRGGIRRSKQNATLARPACKHNESPSYCF